MSETEYVNKYVTFEVDTWNKLKKYSKRPGNRRQAGQQAGFIIKEYLDNNKTMRETWKLLIEEIDLIIAEVPVLEKERLKILYQKRANLELAFNNCGEVV